MFTIKFITSFAGLGYSTEVKSVVICSNPVCVGSYKCKEKGASI